MEEIFAEIVFSRVKAAFAGKGEVSLIPVLKNNGVRRTGISLRGPGRNLAPIVYLDFYYEMCQHGKITLDEAADDICRLLEEYRDYDGPDMEDMAYYGGIRERLVCYLVNRESNRELLEKVPHIPYLDMEIVFAVLAGENTMEKLTVPVYNEFSGKWPGDTGKLLSQALHNMQRLWPVSLKSLHETVKEFIRDCLDGNIPEELVNKLSSDKVPPMYVLSSQTGVHGAAAILYPGALGKAADSLGSDLVILPASIHEMLLVPFEENMDIRKLRDIVRQINKDDLSPEERLSDEVYIYRRETDRVEIAE